jgi:Protein of unknown function (DUF4038)/Putative collagen-binding domain of a collagenase
VTKGMAPKLTRFRLFTTGILLLAVACILIRFRGKIEEFHDSGFSTPSSAEPILKAKVQARKFIGGPKQFITLDPSGRYLINSFTNKPVFLVGDSAWSLITQLSDADVELYLSDRAARGVNYIWCAAADNTYQAHPPRDFNGDRPFDGDDFTHEDEKYWAHVDYVLQRAAAHGITVALDPAFVGLTPADGYLASYQKSGSGVLAAYGEFLARRYIESPNLIWALGGDVNPGTGVLPKIEALAEGIRAHDQVHLMVGEGEPQHSSVDTFGLTNWMDLNWLYFHTTNIPLGVAGNYAHGSGLPSFLGEGWYESEHEISEFEYREQGYWAVLSGANLGDGGFGSSPMWYFNAGPIARAGEPDWRSQLGSEGAKGQTYFGNLFRSREHWLLIPDLNHEAMTSGYDSRGMLSSAQESIRAQIRQEPYRLGSESAVAARTTDGQTIISYIPNGSLSTVAIAMDKITDPDGETKCWWFNPRDGSSSLIGTLAARGTHKFTPPDRNDWVLVIDSERAGLPAPGAKALQD